MPEFCQYVRYHLVVVAVFTTAICGCPPPPPPPPPPVDIASELLESFDTLDMDENGLSFAEAQGGIDSLTQGKFDQLDINNDGLLSRSELGGTDGGEGEGETFWPGIANLYSWDGSSNPASDDLPPDGFFDDVYFDGHEVNGNPSPILPPGNWDFINADTQMVFPLASWDTFSVRVGTLTLLKDEAMAPYGWRINSIVPNAMELDFRADPYAGSSGVDIVDVGSEGIIEFSESFGTGDGPDMLRYTSARAADIRTGSDATGHTNDNDLVIGGSEMQLPTGENDVRTSTIHTGPGRDLVFMNNMERAAIDLGNGANGRTDTLDENDGDDMAVIGRFFLDCRVFGGAGNDTFVWYIDEADPDAGLLKHNFFGGGGWDPAVWEDEGTDRLVLIVPTETVVFSSTDLPTPGTIQVRITTNYSETPVPDPPTENDAFARYFGTAGIGPGGRHTMVFTYHSASGDLESGFIFVTAIEEFQVGLGPDASVYRLDDVAGVAVLAEDLEPLITVPNRNDFQAIMDDFVGR